MAPRRHSGIGALLLAAVLAACGGTTASGIAPKPAAPTTVPAAAEAAPASPTPRILPVTPQADVEFTLADPAFEPLAGATALWGTYEGGAYQIEVPADWNGRVVYYAHGYRLDDPSLLVSPPPIREHLIANGYAWAASSFTSNGYEPGIAAADMLSLRSVVERELGVPDRSYVYGQSMGGHIVTVLLEQHPDVFDGALAECGAVAGNEVLDYFLSWGILAGYFSDTDLTTGATDSVSFGQMIEGSVLPALGPVDALTPKGQAFADVIEHLTGGPRPFFDEGFRVSYSLNFGILGHAIGSAGAANAAAQNLTTTYEISEGFGVTSADLNSAMPRISGNPAFRQNRARYPEFADMTGRIRDPLLTLHNTGDLFVPISSEQVYRQRAEASGSGDLLVQRVIRRQGHCAFSQQEVTAAFDDLVAWVEQGRRPAGDDLLAPLEHAGLRFTYPLEPTDPALSGLTTDATR